MIDVYMPANFDHPHSKSLLRVGLITAVRGTRIEILVDNLKNSSSLFYKGEIIKNVTVGSFLKITKGFNELIAVIDSERIEQRKLAPADNKYKDPLEDITRILEVRLIGFFEAGKFKRGVKEVPLINNEVFLLDQTEYKAIYSPDNYENGSIYVGCLSGDNSLSVHLNIDRFLAAHTGIFGNTGSGKSYSLASLYSQVLDKYKDQLHQHANVRFLLFDFNGEYVSDSNAKTPIIGEISKHEIVLDQKNPGNRIPLTTEMVYDLEFWSILLEATDKTQKPFLQRWLKRIKSISQDDLSKSIGERAMKGLDSILDSSGPLSNTRAPLNYIEQLAKLAEEPFDRLDRDIYRIRYNNKAKSYYLNDEDTGPDYNKVKEKVFREKLIHFLSQRKSKIDFWNLLSIDLLAHYEVELSNGWILKDNIEPLITRFKTRIGDIKKIFKHTPNPKAQSAPGSGIGGLTHPLTVISIKGLEITMRKLIPMLLAKQYYTEMKKSHLKKQGYLNIIIDEAHNILSYDSTRESEQWRDYRLEIFEEIIKEGRKFGVFLTIASQRPQDISRTILSQLHNFVIHRLVNDRDLEAIHRVVSDLDRLSFESIPQLSTGTCILSGNFLEMPLVVDIAPLAEHLTPNSETVSIHKLLND